MSSRWASLVGAALLQAAPVEAQQARELAIHAVATASDPALVVGGLAAGFRPSRRVRLSAGVAVGTSDGNLAARGELLAHFLLSPRRPRGLGVYGAGGIAGVAGPVDEGYLVLTLGVESRPGGTSGWFLEGGVGGGARLAAGWRLRWWGRGG